jgi:hypothetical protein
MRPFHVAIVVAGVVLATRPVEGQTTADETSLRKRIAAHEQAPAQNDLRGLVDVYSLDAEMISGTGTVVRGRDAIEAYYRQQLASASARSGRHHTHPAEAIRITVSCCWDGSVTHPRLRTRTSCCSSNVGGRRGRTAELKLGRTRRIR